MSHAPTSVGSRAVQRNDLFALLAGVMAVGALGPASLRLSVRGTFPPLPLSVVLPVFILGPAISAFVGPILLLAFAPRIAPLRLRDRVPIGTFVLLVLVTVCDALWFNVGAHYGRTYQGAGCVTMYGAANAVWIASSWVLMVAARRVPGPGIVFALHLLFVAGLVSCAFPWLGEYP